MARVRTIAPRKRATGKEFLNYSSRLSLSCFFEHESLFSGQKHILEPFHSSETRANSTQDADN